MKHKHPPVFFKFDPLIGLVAQPMNAAPQEAIRDLPDGYQPFVAGTAYVELANALIAIRKLPRDTHISVAQDIATEALGTIAPAWFPPKR